MMLTALHQMETDFTPRPKSIGWTALVLFEEC
jgi:hypothetical protein